jgi:hypothetical protein
MSYNIIDDDPIPGYQTIILPNICAGCKNHLFWNEKILCVKEDKYVDFNGSCTKIEPIEVKKPWKRVK